MQYSPFQILILKQKILLTTKQILTQGKKGPTKKNMKKSPQTYIETPTTLLTQKMVIEQCSLSLTLQSMMTTNSLPLC